MRQRLRSHLTYSNVISTLCLFLLLGGGSAYALSGSNTVFSDDVVNGQIKAADIGDGEVLAAEIANGQVKNTDIGSGEVRSGNVANDNLTGVDVSPNSLKGGDIDESTLSGIGGGGPAGGDLTGSYPNPLIGPNAVSGNEVTDDSLTGADVVESNLGKVPSASSADVLNGKTAGQLEGARASALVRGNSCGSPGEFCTVLRSKRVAYAFHAGIGQFCVGVDGIAATDPTSIALVTPTFDQPEKWATWWGGVSSNLKCVGTEFEIYTGGDGTFTNSRDDDDFTIVIP